MVGQDYQWFNIIFTDPHYISRPMSHNFELANRELDSYPIALRQGIMTLYRCKVYSDLFANIPD